ncbi:uncharacterized protein DNG_02289 [Cephalotrichum gorgonifer]|uniref:MARVEL domain-containing protein n=1 Tax=Cephalotrichum gorgonifer TaxID=2041049 RepID=A0AAE8MS56_9PEZI|nr:uncharacterized protein DNG_02289 [Cephalotrichum gorgonifer]
MAFSCGKIPFYVARALQLLASCAVAGVMFYFIAHLNKNKSALPWMFYFLQGSALATLIATAATLLWGRFRGPVPLVSVLVSCTLSILWAAGFGLLVDAMKDDVMTPCTVAYWGDGHGILICSLYKTLFVAAGVGVISSVVMTILGGLELRRLKRHAAEMDDRQRLLHKVGSGETGYMPVWGGHSRAPGLEPSRDEAI